MRYISLALVSNVLCYRQVCNHVGITFSGTVKRKKGTSIVLVLYSFTRPKTSTY